MVPYAFILYKTVSSFAGILERQDVSTRIKPSISSRASILRSWWSCTKKKCDYYQVYQAYGPAELTHIGYHSAERLAIEHFAGHSENPGSSKGCQDCKTWAHRLRGEFWSTLLVDGPPVDTDPALESKKKQFGFLGGSDTQK